MDLLKIIHNAATELKSEDIVVFDVRGLSDVCDTQMICSAQSTKQVQAIADHIEAVCRQQAHLRPASVEGKNSGNWILLDYGAVIVHVFMSEMRSYYALESLWKNAETIEL
ncbi:MAG: ribosome silencing factor [Oligoflexales bacterium]